ncbi:LOW QUALITY PROTEIN: Glycoside hydrolase family 25 protein [Caenorhabditis elegans]|uniref:Glycoside hydrolase family 25 protein n=1 Tax=Caenorhabditis elegans TaxID=6239 RepID=O02233_CAEEL|nr:LOW QUALITY PROTEIN: Glycoside hydrolase family 25 protein [Caenorhabditis elegans]CAB05468.2 LOW QUALITY PROTEIN: Glycoside hydrolase family 25 protein [Caenorhabditis elegans]|eukprot:NP_493161.2 LOW QUALITY PROTEIN: LYSozyme [Caenorhabditis elegans]
MLAKVFHLLASVLSISCANYHKAVDVPQDITQDEGHCLWKDNNDITFINTLTSSGLFDSTAPRVFKNLVNYGGDMWFYMKPYPSNGKSGSQQMENVYQGLKSAQIKFSHITVHIGDPQLWSSGSDANTISKDLIQRADQHGISVQFFTSQSNWHSITNNNRSFSSYKLWWAHTNGAGNGGATSPNFEGFVSFGGWTSSSLVGKEYARQVQECGVTVNKYVYVK